VGVPYVTIVRKLSEQIALAEQHVEDPLTFKHHISQVKLLCELILDEQKSKLSDEQLQVIKSKSNEAKVSLENEQTLPKDLPGDSIFDF